MYPYWVAVAVPMTDLLNDPPVSTNWTFVIPAADDAEASRVALVPLRSAPVEGTRTVVETAGFTVRFTVFVEVEPM